jgi:hypothetical protein
MSAPFDWIGDMSTRTSFSLGLSVEILGYESDATTINPESLDETFTRDFEDDFLSFLACVSPVATVTGAPPIGEDDPSASTWSCATDSMAITLSVGLEVELFSTANGGVGGGSDVSCVATPSTGVVGPPRAAVAGAPFSACVALDASCRFVHMFKIPSIVM